MRPGKPLMHGQLTFGTHRVPVLGLPGNPVSALICAALFLMPAIARLLGRSVHEPPVHQVRLGVALPANDQRADHIRATLDTTDGGERVATPMPTQDSARLRDLLRAEALILRPPGAGAASAGDLVDILLLADFGI
jgi:molybdopterin molybdotransferase